MKFVPLLLLCVTITGCFSAARRRPYAGIANAAVVAGTDAKDVYATAEQQYYNQQMDNLVEHFATDGYVPGHINELISEQDLKSRLEAADMLLEYGAAIQRAIAEPKAVTATTSSKGPTPTTAKKGAKTKTPLLTQANINMITQGVQEIGRIIASGELAKNLPKTVKAADPSVQQICGLLITDIGTDSSLGLRSEIQELYDSRLMKQNQFIRDNWDHMSAVERRVEIEKLPMLEKEAADTDKRLEKTAKELKDVADLSHRLAGGR